MRYVLDSGDRLRAILLEHSSFYRWNIYYYSHEQRYYVSDLDRQTYMRYVLDSGDRLRALTNNLALFYYFIHNHNFNHPYQYSGYQL
jgi:hypothetical protein